MSLPKVSTKRPPPPGSSDVRRVSKGSAKGFNCFSIKASFELCWGAVQCLGGVAVRQAEPVFIVNVTLECDRTSAA
jgi:hypothetical protein